MAKKDDLFYRPSIDDIEKDIKHTEETYLSDSDIEDFKQAQKEILGRSTKSEQEKLIDLYDSWIEKMDINIEKAKILRERTEVMLNINIENLDTDVCDAPGTIKQYIYDVVGKEVPDDKTDPACSIPKDIIKCIFKTAGYYGAKEAPILEGDNAAQKIKEAAVQTFGQMEYVQLYGLKLLLIVIKLCALIIVHYTMGYCCKYFRSNFKKKILGKTINLGKPVSKLFGKVEKMIINKMGYSCSSRSGETTCEGTDWEDIDIKKYSCCSYGSFLFKEYTDPNGKVRTGPSACFKRIVRMEMAADDPEKYRNICSTKNKDQNLNPDPSEVQKAKYIVDYIMNKKENRTTKAGSSSNVNVLGNTSTKTNEAEMLSKQVKSSLAENRGYVVNTEKASPNNCFGLVPGDEEMFKPDLQGENSPVTGMPTSITEDGMFFLESIKGIDEAITKLLETADRAVVSSAMLLQFSSSKQLCCWVYLYVYIASLIGSLIKKGSFCSDMKCDDEKYYDDPKRFIAPGCQDAIRNEMRWAAGFKGSEEIGTIVAVLKALKQIVDMFIRKQKQQEFLQGLRLPLHDMFEEIKYVLMTAMAGYMDILLGPFDIILSSIRMNPEMRNMINNECFGFLDFLDMLSCMIGNLKASVLNFVGKILNRSISDFQLISDIYLSRTRLASLEAFSKLLQNMLNLIASLSDCYDPQDLASKIVDREIEDQYNEYRKYKELVGDREEYVNEAAVPITDITVKIDPADGDPNSDLQKAFGDLEIGAKLEQIVYNELIDNKDLDTLATTAFVKDDGSELTRAEFINKIEEITGVTVLEVKESLHDKIFEMIRSGFNEES